MPESTNRPVNGHKQSAILPEKTSLLQEASDPDISLENIRSEEMTEIIGKMPHCIIRRGMIIIGMLCMLMLFGAYHFKYPDIIPAKVIITSDNPPVKLVAHSSLPIQKIFVKNDELVTIDQTLCVFSNAANYANVMEMAALVNRLDTVLDITVAIKNIAIPTKLQLGALQPNYIELYQAVQQYKFFLLHNAYDASIGSLSNQVGYSNQLEAEQRARQHLQQQQLVIQQRQFAADSSLLNARIISRVEYEESKRKMLDQQINSGNNKTVLIQNKLQAGEYTKAIAISTLQKTNDENDLIQKIKEAVRRFQGQFAQWQQTYVLKSPARGKVSFFSVWKENQFINSGEGIMMIVPQAGDFIVRGTAGTDRYGKIKTGQKVLLKLQAYPYEEYGMLEAVLTKRTLVAMDKNFALEMKLKQGLVTNSGRIIPPNPMLEADAEIITDDKSILARLFEKVIKEIR